MSNKKLIAVALMIVVILGVGYAKFSGHIVKTDNVFKSESDGVQNETAVVGRVIDGDTVMLTNGERVRLIGMDTLEKGERCFQESKDRMNELVGGKEIILEKDVQDRDRYNRTLRYIFVGDKFVNLLLVREGLATVYTIEPNVKYVKQFEQALVQAREDGTGCLWR